MTSDELLQGLPTKENTPSPQDNGDGGRFGIIGKQLSADDLLKDLPTEGAVPPSDKTSATATAARAAVSELGPGAAAAAAFTPGAGVGAEFGAPLGPVGAGVGSLLGGIISSGTAAWAASKAQHAIAETVAPQATEEFNRKLEAGEQQHPVAGAIGRIASALPMFEFSPGQSVQGMAAMWKAARGVPLTAAEKLAAQTTAQVVGIGVGQSVVQPLLFGDSPTRQGIAEAFVQSLVLGHPRYEIFGRHAAEQIAKEDAKKDAQTEQQRNDVEQPANTYTATPPPPSLTPEQRGDLAELAGRVASGAPVTGEDAALSRLMSENEDARKYFNQQKEGWAQLFAHKLIGMNKPESGLFDEVKPGDEAGPVDEFLQGNKPAKAEPTPTEEPTPVPIASQPVAETPAPAAPVASPVYQPSLEGQADIHYEPNEEETPTPAPVVSPVSQPAPVAEPEWMKHHGDAGQFVDQFANVAESGAVAVKGTGTGQNRADLYTDLAGMTPAQAKSEVAAARTADKNSGVQSRKLVAMLSPDKTHVLVGTASETTSGGKRTLKVSTYDVGAGRKSPGGEHYASSYDKLIELGWQPLASMKVDRPMKGFFATYSPEEWQRVSGQLSEMKAAGQRTAEAMMGHLEQAREFGRTEATEATNENEKAELEENNLGKTAPDAVESSGNEEATHFDHPHAEAIWDALSEHEPESPQEVLSALAKNNVFSAIDPLIRDLGLDPKKQSAKEIADVVSQFIFDHYDRASKTTTGGESEAFTESILRESREQLSGEGQGERANAQPVRSPEPAGGATPAGSEPGRGGTETGAVANGGGGEAGPAEPDTGTGAGASENAPRVSVVDSEGLTPKERTKLQAIAERIAKGMGHEGRDAIESAADEIQDGAIAVRVNDEPGLIHGDRIYTLSGKEYPLTAEVLADVGKFRHAQARAELERMRPSEVRTATVAATVERNLRAVGVRVDRVVDALAKHFAGGSYRELVNGKGNAVRIITWTVADAYRPSRENLVSLFHEVFHALFARETPEMQAAAHRAVEAMTNEQLGIGNFRESVSSAVPPQQRAGIEQEGRLGESLARKLVAEGFDPAAAGTWTQRALRLVRDIYHGTLMALAKAARYPVSQERAMKYFENRMRMVLAGDESMSWLNFLGGPRMRMPDWGNLSESMRYSRPLDSQGNLVRNEADAINRLNPAERAKVARSRGEYRVLAQSAAEVLTRDRQSSEEARHLEQAKTPGQRAEIERKIGAREETVLSHFAEQAGLLLDPHEFERKWNDYAKEVGVDHASGMEHEVYPEGDYFIKRNPVRGEGENGTMGPHYTWLDYFNRLKIHNQMFPDAAYDFLGFMKDERGKLYAVTRQPDIKNGEHVTMGEVKDFMEAQGYQKIPNSQAEDYYSPKTGVVIGDLHDQNVVKLPNGKLVVFDPNIELARPTDFAKPISQVNGVNVGGGRLYGMHPPERYVDPVNKSDVGTRYSGINPVFNPRKYLETPEGAPVGIAALNEVMASVRELVKQWDIRGNTAGLSDEQIVQHFIAPNLPEKVGDSDLFVNGATPMGLIAEASRMHGVSPETRIADLPNDIAKQRAAAVTHAVMSAMKAEMAGTAMEARHEWKSATHELEQNQGRLTRMTKDYVDIDFMADTAKKAMLALVDDLRNTVRGVRDFAAQEGAIGQVMKDLNGVLRNGADLPKPYRQALDQLHAALMKPEESSKFSETLQHIGSMDIDWRMPSRAIAEGLRQQYLATNDARLRPLVEDTERGRTLMATVIGFGKSNSHLMDLLAMRSEKAGEDRMKANGLLKDLLAANRGALGELVDRIKDTFGKNQKMRDRMLRIADKVADLKERNNELVDTIARNKAMVDYHEDTFKPVMDEQMAGLERTAGIQLKQFEVYHGAEVPVPNHSEARPDQFTGQKLSLRSDIGKRGERPTPTPEVVGWMQKMQGWIDNPENQKFGAKYNEVADALDKLKNHYVTDEHLNLKGSMATRMMGPIQERCNQAGTPAARMAGQAFNRYSALLRAKVREVVQHGTNFSAALNDARLACGYPAASEQTFWDNVVAPALHDLEQNGEQFWARARTADEMVNGAVHHALKYMDLDGRARVAVEKLLRQHIFNADLMVKNGAELGNKVLDEAGDYRIYRPVLGKAPFTLPRALTDIAQNFYREHMAGVWGGDSFKANKIAELYEQDPILLREETKKFFTQPVWDWFMRSLAYNDKAHFYAPSDGGVAPLASRENIIKAYEAAGGDVVNFAENLARLQDRRADGAFVAETLDTIQNFHNLLRTMVGDEAETVQHGSPNPKRFIVDARHIEAAPKEWMNYLMGDQYNMEKIIHGQAFQAAFGRNGMAMDKNLSTALNEQQLMADRYDAWREAMVKADPGLNEKQLQQAIKDRCAQEGISFTALKEARTNLMTLRGVAKDFEAIKGINNTGKIPELQPWARLVRTIGGWTVSGMGTAITAHSVFLEQPTRLFGLGTRSLSMTARSVGDLAKVMANSMLQAIGRECVFESDRMLDANEAGLFDPINTNKQRLVTAFNHAYAAYQESGRIGQAVGKAADVGGAVLQADVFAPGARAAALQRQASGQAIAPTAKLFSPFHWIAECLQISNFITWQRHIEGMVAAGVKHVEQQPELLERMRSGQFVPSHEWFGMGDREYRFLNQRLADFGYSVNQLISEAYRNRGSEKPILSPEVNKAIQQLTLNEITLESSLTSRTPGLQTSGLGVAMNPFLGWPLQKTYQVLRQMREPNGEATTKALRTGLTAYMAILPIGMAVAWLRNKFDEELLGRKQNISDLSTIHDPKSALMTALDNASRVGTFGFLGEGANYFLNDDNVRPLSVDSRVFFLNTMENTFNAARSLYGQTMPQVIQGNLEGAAKTATDYQSVIRPVFQTLGGNGLLQNLGAVNHLLSLDDAESRVSNRISVNNYLRVAGRELSLDVRTFDGMLQNQSAPGPIKPFIGQMVLAAYSNDHEAFNQAMRDAVRQARAEGMSADEALKKVTTMYEGQNPLKIVFKSVPTEAEYRKLLAQLPDSGKQSVMQAMTLYQHYGQQIGAKAASFGKDKAPSGAATGTSQPIIRDDVAAGVLNRLRGNAALQF